MNDGSKRPFIAFLKDTLKDDETVLEYKDWFKAAKGTGDE
jgi:hypothetical protein